MMNASGLSFLWLLPLDFSYKMSLVSTSMRLTLRLPQVEFRNPTLVQLRLLQTVKDENSNLPDTPLSLSIVRCAYRAFIMWAHRVVLLRVSRSTSGAVG